MTGRTLFQRLRPVLTPISLLLSVIPRLLFELTWPILELVPWKLGIFLRYLWAKRLAKSCGENVLFETGVRVTYWDQIELGSNVAIFETCYLDGKGGIRIGNNVSIAHQSSLISFDFDVTDPSIPLKYSAIRKKPITIGNDVMIFSGVRVFAGATIEDRTIIAANAVVRDGTYTSGVYAGLPAVKKKDL